MFTIENIKQLHEIIQSGAAVITTRENLATAVPGETVYPQTVDGGKYVHQTRVGEDGNPVSAVSLCSKGQFLNEIERVFAEHRRNGVYPLDRANIVKLTYPPSAGSDNGVFHDYDLPGRAADMHVQSGTTTSGVQVLQDSTYVEALESQNNSAALLNLSVISAALGLWDSRRPKGVKVPSAMRGEVYGVCATQTRDPNTGAFIIDHNESGSGWRKDPFKSKYNESVVSKVKQLLGKDALTEKAAKAKTAAELGIGNAPASGNGGVAVKDIVRYSVIVLPIVRALTVSDDDEENLKAQTVMLAFLLSLSAMSRKVSHYRAGCDLVKVSVSSHVDGGEFETLELDDSLKLLEAAIADAGSLPVGFEGNVYAVNGNPDIQKEGKDDTEEGSK